MSKLIITITAGSLSPQAVDISNLTKKTSQLPESMPTSTFMLVMDLFPVTITYNPFHDFNILHRHRLR